MTRPHVRERRMEKKGVSATRNSKPLQTPPGVLSNMS